MLAHLTSIFHAKHPPSEVRACTAREVRLWASALAAELSAEAAEKVMKAAEKADMAAL